MNKMIAVMLCLILTLLLVGCGTKSAESEGFQNDAIAAFATKQRDGDTTVKIEGVVYYNTNRAISVEPIESVIVNMELPLDGSPSNEKVTAYAFISEEQLGDILACLIDGEWYQFIETDRAGKP